MGKILAMVFGTAFTILFIVIGGAIIFGDPSTQATTSLPTTPLPSKVLMTEWHSAIFATNHASWIMFKIHNANDYVVKDFKIKCDGFGRSGTKIDSATKIAYVQAPANGGYSGSINMGYMDSQVDTISCRLVGHS